MCVRLSRTGERTVSRSGFCIRIAVESSLMGESAVGDVCLLRGGGCAAQDLIAMGMSAESRDNPSNLARLIDQRCVDRPQTERRCGGNVFAQGDQHIEALEMVGAFAMAERQTEDDPEPWHLQRRIMPARASLGCQRKGMWILREGPRVIAPDRAGELIKEDDQRQPPVRILRPVIKGARAAFSVRSENCAMIWASAPPRIRQSQCA